MSHLAGILESSIPGFPAATPSPALFLNIVCANRKTLDEVEKTAAEVQKKRAEVEKEEKSQPLNVDTLSKDGFTKTIINTAPVPREELSEEEKERRMKKFVKENEKLIKEYGMLQKFDDSKRFLLDGKTHLGKPYPLL